MSPPCKLTILRADHIASYTLTFMLLAAEMATFVIFVAPLPFAVRKRFFNFLASSPIIAKVAYGLKISFMYAGDLHHEDRLADLVACAQIHRYIICGCASAHVPGRH